MFQAANALCSIAPDVMVPLVMGGIPKNRRQSPWRPEVLIYSPAARNHAEYGVWSLCAGLEDRCSGRLVEYYK